MAAEFWSNAGRQGLNGAEPTWRLPAGKYDVVSLNLTEIEPGNRWGFELSWPGELGDFEIKPGRTTAFKIGPPFETRGSMGTSCRNPDVHRSFRAGGTGGRAGQRCCLQERRRGRPNPPSGS